MKALLLYALTFLCAGALPAQTAAPAPSAATPVAPRVSQTHSNDIGFSYSLPLDWEVVDTKPMVPVLKQQQAQAATSDEEKKGIACVQIALMARHGDPSSQSIVEVMALSYDCFGQQLADKDLAGFATGVAGGIKKAFDLPEPVYGAYSLGTHSVWIERAQGSLIAHPEFKRTVETACILLKKGAVCWITMAADQEALDTFEHGAVTLDGENAAALVPAGAFQAKAAIKPVIEKNPGKN